MYERISPCFPPMWLCHFILSTDAGRLKYGDFLWKYPFSLLFVCNLCFFTWNYPFSLCYLFAIFVSLPANQWGYSCATRWPIKDSAGTWNFCPDFVVLKLLYFLIISHSVIDENLLIRCLKLWCLSPCLKFKRCYSIFIPTVNFKPCYSRCTFFSH